MHVQKMQPKTINERNYIYRAVRENGVRLNSKIAPETACFA
jgi:hypothetical protein